MEKDAFGRRKEGKALNSKAGMIWKSLRREMKASEKKREIKQVKEKKIYG